MDIERRVLPQISNLKGIKCNKKNLRKVVIFVTFNGIRMHNYSLIPLQDVGDQSNLSSRGELLF